MEIKKLKSALKSQTGLLLANALLFGWLLTLAASSRSWLWIFVYILYLVYAYIKFLKNDALKLTVLFTVFSTLSYLALIWAGNPAAFWIMAVISVALFFVFLGAQLFYFSQTKVALSIFFHAILFGTAAYFASIAPFELWWGAVPILYLVIYYCTKDYLKFETGSFDGRKKIYALTFAFVALQCAWVASLLPFGFLNAGLIVLVFSIVANDLFLAHFFGKLSPKLILVNVGFFSAFITLVFIAGSL